MFGNGLNDKEIQKYFFKQRKEIKDQVASIKKEMDAAYNLLYESDFKLILNQQNVANQIHSDYAVKQINLSYRKPKMQSLEQQLKKTIQEGNYLRQVNE